MKLKGNLMSGAKLAMSVLRLNKYIKPLERARESGDTDEERRIIAELSSAWINDVIEIFDMDLDIKGRENIPEGPCVFVANHQGYADVPAMLKALEGHATGFIAKEEFKPVPLLAPWIERVRGLFIPTQRGDTRESLRVINEGVEIINKGFSMAIYPEGKRSWGPVMDELKGGSFKLATKAKVPVVPITIDGTYRMFEEHERITKGQSAKITIHPPIETAGMSRAEQAELHTRVEEIIRSALPNNGYESETE